MQLFYNPKLNEHTKELVFEKEESRHIIKVLRKKENDILHITNGKGYLFEVKIIVPNEKKCLAKVMRFELVQNNRDYYLHIAIAPTKSNDRFEWFLEKATEIGIDEITPIICKNSERKTIKIERLQKIVQSALKQSLQCTIPKINEPTTFDKFISQEQIGEKYIAHCEKDEDKHFIKNIAQLHANYTVLIGPEGDFDKKEIELSKSQQYRPLSLGYNRLRTETAGIVCVHSFSCLHE